MVLQALVQLRGVFSSAGLVAGWHRQVSFIPLDPTEPDSIAVLLQHIDNSVQYGEDVEPKAPEDKYNDD